MLIPAPRLLKTTALLVVASIAVSIWPALLGPWIAAAIALAVVALLDAREARRLPAPAVERIVSGSLPLGVRQEVTLRASNRAARVCTVALQDHCPEGMDAEGLPIRLRVAAGGWGGQRYAIRPVRRGELRFDAVSVRMTSRLGLWQAQHRIALESTVRVYPNFAALTKYALLATDNRLSQIGVLQRRRRGEGLDFHQLREYREGDSPRQIDWKATARMRKLVSREYQDERDQQVVLLLDCGRRMGAQDGELAHFDHALNAALLLAYVSLRQGDAVGLMTMAGPARWLPPRKSRATIDLLLNAVYDLQPTLSATDYYVAAMELMKRLRKRALIVIVTNMRDEDDDSITPALRLLQQRHLVVLASLREASLGRVLHAPVEALDDALTHAATADYLRQRDRAFQRIATAGAQCFDVEPQQLPITLVNRYLDIKRAGRL